MLSLLFIIYEVFMNENGTSVFFVSKYEVISLKRMVIQMHKELEKMMDHLMEMAEVTGYER